MTAKVEELTKKNAQDQNDPDTYDYGDTIDEGPDDAEAVLLRWKVSERQYRVIFGDLSAMEVTAEELGDPER